MPIQRFENLDDARAALWRRRDDPELPSRIRALWDRAFGLLPVAWRAPRGLRRYRTVAAPG